MSWTFMLRYLRYQTRHSARALVAPLTGALLLAACAPNPDLQPIAGYNPSTYTLGVDDQIRMVTYGEDQLTLDFRINGAGAISVPLIGSVTAVGLTTQQLGSNISELLEEKKLFKGASVSVEVTAYRTISVLGEVVKPGQYPYQPGMTMLTAVAAAGGFTYRAFQPYAYVIRQQDGAGAAQVGRIDPQDYVKPGDVMKIYQRFF